MWTCWGITDGSAGMAAQVRALAAGLGLQPEMKTVALKKPWKFLPNIFYATFLKKYILTHALKNPQTLTAHLPDIIISCGRKGALAAAALKSAHHAVRVIHIQDPQMPSSHFDLVVAMAHDKITGENVIKTKYALHTITPELLDIANKKFTPRFAKYPSPKIAILLGGSTNKYTLTHKKMQLVIAALDALLGDGASLLITPSRRTGEKNIALLKQHFRDNEKVYIYDFIEENPYLGLLAVADEVTVTNDSVNMMSEAYATGKPLHILRFCGHANTKPANFAESLVASGSAKWRSTGGATAHTPENEMHGLVEKIKALLSL